MFFRDLGFSEYEARIIATLVKIGKASPKEISFDSGVPQNKIYAIFRNFEKLGILSVLPTEPKKYQLINLDGLIKKRIKERETRAKELREVFKGFERMQDRDEQFIFSLIKGQKAIMNKLVEANKKVKKEIFGVQRNWKYWGEGIRAMENAVKRGVDIRLIGIVDKGTEKRVGEWKEIGCKIKSYNGKFGEYPLRFSVFDNKYARITIGKPEVKESKDYITIWTDSKPLVQMLRNQFLQMWKESKKV